MECDVVAVALPILVRGTAISDIGELGILAAFRERTRAIYPLAIVGMDCHAELVICMACGLLSHLVYI